MATKQGTLTSSKSLSHKVSNNKTAVNKGNPKQDEGREAPALASTIAKSPQEAAHFSLLQAGDLIQNRLGRVLREYDLTLSQYHVLRILEHAGAPLPSLEIANRMPQVVPAITGLLTRLEEQGHVRRKQDKDDKRVTQVESTTKAKALLKKLEKPVLDLHKDLSKSLSEVEAKQLSKLLEKFSPSS